MKPLWRQQHCRYFLLAAKWNASSLLGHHWGSRSSTLNIGEPVRRAHYKALILPLSLLSFPLLSLSSNFASRLSPPPFPFPFPLSRFSFVYSCIQTETEVEARAHEHTSLSMTNHARHICKSTPHDWRHEVKLGGQLAQASSNTRHKHKHKL